MAHPPQTPKQAFFEQKDKETEVSVVYDKGPLRRKSAGFTTVNLSGRQMVASAADAQKNTVDTDVTEKVVTKKLAETSLTVNGIKRFEQELAKLALEQAGSYVARNTCDDNFWVCASDCEELTFVSYEEPDGGA